MQRLSTSLRTALESRGFSNLTPVQEAVLAPKLAGRDLLISSQTGSGKTIAMAIVFAPLLAQEGPDPAPKAAPTVLVLVPTRELAAQVREELAWAFRPAKKAVIALTGGTEFRSELRLLKAGGAIVVGTPGRVLDHCERRSFDTTHLRCVVLDEADQMLDLGFRDSLEAILNHLPPERQTHLVSATFSREVLALAERYQKDPVHVEGTQLGTANRDIRHCVHVVASSRRFDAIVNLLLMRPGERTLLFVRTRADTTGLAEQLIQAGFRAAPISGDLEQKDRTRTLEAFRSGNIPVLVATDVAARGIDVQDIGRIIHVDPPNDADTYTHRSGRTGRAGRKGESLMLVAPGMREMGARLLKRAKVEAVWAPLPTVDEVLQSTQEWLFSKMVQPREPSPSHEPYRRLASRLLKEIDPVDLVARLIEEAPQIAAIMPSAPRVIAQEHHQAPGSTRAKGSRGSPQTSGYQNGSKPRQSFDRAPNVNGHSSEAVPFAINWGQRHGADPRRLLAIVCRRGQIRGAQVGAIDIGPDSSRFEVAGAVASSFEAAVRNPDQRDPNLRITRYRETTSAEAPPRAVRRKVRPSSGVSARASRPLRSRRQGRSPWLPSAVTAPDGR